MSGQTHHSVTSQGVRPANRPDVTHALTLGVCRFLMANAISPLTEFKLKGGRRADVAGIDGAGRFTIVEVKSSPADFNADAKWPDYLKHADFFYFAVAADFPLDLLPAEHGVLVCDRFGAAAVRPAVEAPMNANRRRHQTLSFARQAATGLIRTVDPGV